MRWPLAIFIGVINAILSGAVAGVAADFGTRWHGVSEMEGGRAMAIVFVFVPLGLLVGLVTGILIARSGNAASFRDGLGRLARSAAISLSLVAAALGAAWASADHPPTIDGRTLVLQFEVRLPPGFPVRDSLEQNGFRVGLVVSSSDRDFMTVDYTRVARSDSFVVVPGRGSLNSVGMRTISVNHGGYGPEGKPSQFVDIPLAPRPSKNDFEWTDWMVLPKRMDLSDVPVAERALVRYRVQFDSTAR